MWRRHQTMVTLSRRAPRPYANANPLLLSQATPLFAALERIFPLILLGTPTRLMNYPRNSKRVVLSPLSPALHAVLAPATRHHLPARVASCLDQLTTSRLLRTMCMTKRLLPRTPSPLHDAICVEDAGPPPWASRTSTFFSGSTPLRRLNFLHNQLG